MENEYIKENGDINMQICIDRYRSSNSGILSLKMLLSTTFDYAI